MAKIRFKLMQLIYLYTFATKNKQSHACHKSWENECLLRNSVRVQGKKSPLTYLLGYLLHNKWLPVNHLKTPDL